MQLDLEVGIDALGNQMAYGAHTGRANIELPRLAACQRNELPIVVHAQIGVHRKHRGDGRQRHHGDKGFGLVKPCRLRQHDRVHNQRADGAKANGVAIRRGIGHGFCADQAAGTRAVVNHHGLTETGVHGICNDARHEIGGAAGRERHHQPDGPLRVARISGLHRTSTHQRQQTQAANFAPQTSGLHDEGTTGWSGHGDHFLARQ